MHDGRDVRAFFVFDDESDGVEVNKAILAVPDIWYPYRLTGSEDDIRKWLPMFSRSHYDSDGFPIPETGEGT